MPATRRWIGAKWSSTIVSSGRPGARRVAGAGRSTLPSIRRHLALRLRRPSGRHCRPWCRGRADRRPRRCDQRASRARRARRNARQRRIDAGQQARDLQAAARGCRADQPHVGDVLVPDLDVLLEVQARTRFAAPRCRLAAAAQRHPWRSVGRRPSTQRLLGGELAGRLVDRRSGTPCDSRPCVNRPGMPLVSGSPLARSKTLQRRSARPAPATRERRDSRRRLRRA